MVQLKLDMARALAPKEPEITQEDVDAWNGNLKRTGTLEDLLKQLQKEVSLMDGTKIKADIL